MRVPYIVPVEASSVNRPMKRSATSARSEIVQLTTPRASLPCARIVSPVAVPLLNPARPSANRFHDHVPQTNLPRWTKVRRPPGSRRPLSLSIRTTFHSPVHSPDGGGVCRAAGAPVARTRPARGRRPNARFIGRDTVPQPIEPTIAATASAASGASAGSPSAASQARSSRPFAGHGAASLNSPGKARKAPPASHSTSVAGHGRPDGEARGEHGDGESEATHDLPPRRRQRRGCRLARGGGTPASAS
jgi:hypothetical protein